jgi:2'-5' RNA ligase
MDGIVSLLDVEHQNRVESLWRELEQTFGLRGVYATRFPHFSYHVAEAYDESRLTSVLARLAQDHAPFHIYTTGLGIFTGPQPVLYIPVVRTPKLTLLHQELWLAVNEAASGTVELYHPRAWVPHITLANGDIHNEMLPDVISRIGGRSFSWKVTVARITVVISAGTTCERQLHFSLQGA